jgi:triacylglycerol lipase
MISLIQSGMFLLQILGAGLIARGLQKWAGINANWVAWAIGLIISFSIYFLIIGLQFVLSRQTDIHEQSLPSNQVPEHFQTTTNGLIVAWLTETITCVYIFCWLQPVLSWFAYAKPGATTSQKVPVLLLHGFFCNRGLWHSFAGQLAQRGHLCLGINLEPVWASIDDYVPSITKAIDQLIEQTGQQKIAVVAHSMGGLAIRAYIRQYGNEKIARVVTLGAPHQGTYISEYGHGKNVGEMALQSKWRDELMLRETPARNAIFTVIISHDDNIVAPQNIQTIAGAKKIEVAGIGHLYMIFDSGIRSLVYRELDQIKPNLLS